MAANHTPQIGSWKVTRKRDHGHSSGALRAVRPQSNGPEKKQERDRHSTDAAFQLNVAA
jgi:hypothetical protein